MFISSAQWLQLPSVAHSPSDSVRHLSWSCNRARTLFWRARDDRSDINISSPSPRMSCDVVMSRLLRRGSCGLPTIALCTSSSWLERSICKLSSLQNRHKQHAHNIWQQHTPDISSGKALKSLASNHAEYVSNLEQGLWGNITSVKKFQVLLYLSSFKFRDPSHTTFRTMCQEHLRTQSCKGLGWNWFSWVWCAAYTEFNYTDESGREA